MRSVHEKSDALLVVTDWSDRYENNRTRELKRLDWAPIPNQMDGDGYTELLSHPNGAAHYGAWLALVLIASRCDTRGQLMRSGGKPHDAESLSRISRIPVKVFREAIPRFVDIGWLSAKPLDHVTIPHPSATLPQDDAGIPQEGAASRARDERNGTEGNGTEGKEPQERANGKSPHPILDADWFEFRIAAEESGMGGSEPDWDDAFRWHWRLMDFGLRLAALQGLADRRGTDDPAIKSLPQNYLKQRKWERPIRSPTVAAKDAGVEFLKRRLREAEAREHHG